MKKLLTIILALCILGTFVIFALGSGSSDDNDQETQSSVDSTEKPEENSNTLGDYAVDIVSYRLAKDYEGKDVVIVKYHFTNVKNDNAQAFYIALDDTVYQNGVSLNNAYFLSDDADYNSDNQTKEIKKGASIDVEVAYELNDTTTDIEVEVKELISFNEKTVTKTFIIK